MPETVPGLRAMICRGRGPSHSTPKRSTAPASGRRMARERQVRLLSGSDRAGRLQGGGASAENGPARSHGRAQPRLTTSASSSFSLRCRDRSRPASSMHAVAAGPQLDVQAVVLPEELGRFRRVDPA